MTHHTPAPSIPARGRVTASPEPDLGAGKLRGELRGMPLSPREQDVLVAIVNEAPPRRGRKYSLDEAAAAALGLSVCTVKNYLESICLKLGAQNTVHAVALAFPLLADRYIESPERRRMQALAVEVLRRRIAA